LRFKERDLWDGLEKLSTYVEKQRSLIANVPDTKGADRLELSRKLALGGSMQSQLGRFARAREWFGDALDQFQQLNISVRVSEIELKDSIVLGYSGCLLLEHRFDEAEKFIDGVLAQDVFSAYPSSAHRYLSACKALLSEFADSSRGATLVPSADELWGELTEEVLRCETPEAARAVRRKIVSMIRTHDVNRRIQALADAVVKVLKKQEQHLVNIQPPPTAIPSPPRKSIDLSAIGDSDDLKALKKVIEDTDALSMQLKDSGKVLAEAGRAFYQLARTLIDNNVERVRSIASEIDRVPFSYAMKWWFWSTIRFALLIVAVGYFLEEVAVDLIKEKGNSLLEILSIQRTTLIVTIVVLLVNFVVGRFMEEKANELLLSRYKRLLTGIVSNRSMYLWRSYNALLKLNETAMGALKELEEQIKGLSGEGSAST
jgi:hypothetical protein